MERQGRDGYMITTEHQEQALLFQWALLYQDRYPQLGMLYAIPNGAYKSKSAAGRFKAEGLKSGVPDICLPVESVRWRGRVVNSEDGGGWLLPYHSLYIEMKRKGGRISPTQQVWLDWLNKYGNYACVCYSADEAIAKIKWYLNIE